MPQQHKCGIAGCKKLIPQRSCICREHRELLQPELLRLIDSAYSKRLAGDTSALNTYYSVLAQGTLAVQRKKDSRPDLFGDL